MALLQLPRQRGVRASDLGAGPGRPGAAQLHALRAGQPAVRMATQDQARRQGAVDLLVGRRAQPNRRHPSWAGRWERKSNESKRRTRLPAVLYPFDIFPTLHIRFSSCFGSWACNDCMISWWNISTHEWLFMRGGYMQAASFLSLTSVCCTWAVLSAGFSALSRCLVFCWFKLCAVCLRRVGCIDPFLWRRSIFEPHIAHIYNVFALQLKCLYAAPGL